MNNAETKVAEYLGKRGFHVVRNGWPDFLCVKKVWCHSKKDWIHEYTGVMTVEVKNGKDELSENQKIVHDILKAVGIPCYVIRPTEIDAENVISDRTRKKRGLERRKLWTAEDLEKIRFKAKDVQQQLERFKQQVEYFGNNLERLEDELDQATVMMESSLSLAPENESVTND